jgi:hypothetical protein
MLAASLVAGPASARCTSDQDQAAFDVNALKTELMLMAVSSECRREADYNAFINRFRQELIAADGHVVLSFDRLKVGDGLDGQGKGLVKAWSLEKGLGRAKLSFDLARRAHIKRRFLLPPSDGLTVYRYVMDIEADGPPTATASAPPAPAVMPQPAKTRILKTANALSAPVVTTWPLRRWNRLTATSGGSA